MGDRGEGGGTTQSSQFTTVMPSVTMQRSLPLLLLLLLAIASLRQEPAAAAPHKSRGLVPRGWFSRRGPQRQDSVAKTSSAEKFLALVLQGLAITGLSLLFPTVVTVNTGRRRRRRRRSTTGE